VFSTTVELIFQRLHLFHFTNTFIDTQCIYYLASSALRGVFTRVDGVAATIPLVDRGLVWTVPMLL
jgi:hypothetical protein